MTDGDLWFFDRIGVLYDLAMPSADPETLTAGLERADRDIDRVLDVGGGTGRATRAIDAPERIVLDASAGMLSRVPSGIERVRGSATALPVSDARVDAVLIVDALHHLPERRTAIREAARVLRPGGVLVVREFDGSTLRGRLLELAEHAIGMRSSFFSADDIAAVIAGADLDPIVLDRGFACTVVGRKPGA